MKSYAQETFESRDVLSGLATMRPNVGRGGLGAELMPLPWTARRTDGSILEGSACALVVEGAIAVGPELAAYGPDTRSDLGVGVTLDLPAPVGEATVLLFDIAGRKVATRTPAAFISFQ